MYWGVFLYSVIFAVWNYKYYFLKFIWRLIFAQLLESIVFDPSSTPEWLIFYLKKYKMDLELPIVLYVEVGKRVKNLYNSKFRKMLPVYSILRNSELSYIEILKFVQNLPFCFICSQSYPRNIFQRNFSILCSKCVRFSQGLRAPLRGAL